VATVLFDFDSTLIDCESLEAILEPALRARPDLRAAIRAITDAGMEGRLPFAESLRRRLELAAPTLANVLAFAGTAHRRLTAGMEAVIAGLAARGADVWIVSGAVREALLPLGRRLGLPEGRILGARLRWNDDGSLLGVDEADGFGRSKVEGVRQLGPRWPAPRIGVGDGMSDYALLEAGLVDRFVAFTGVVRRAPVVATGAPEARNARELADLLDNLL
jgi:HAD superfamily phosphoserine phosphatase-like hydrolase